MEQKTQFEISLNCYKCTSVNGPCGARLDATERSRLSERGINCVIAGCDKLMTHVIGTKRTGCRVYCTEHYEEKLCHQVLRNGNRCKKNAVVGGYCQTHKQSG